MEENLNQVLLAATVLGTGILVATQIIKQVVGDKKWLPIFNALFGVIFGVLWALSFDGGHVVLYAWGGLFAGMSAGGAYDLGANVKGLFNQNKSTTLINDGKGEQDNREEGE